MHLTHFQPCILSGHREIQGGHNLTLVFTYLIQKQTLNVSLLNR